LREKPIRRETLFSVSRDCGEEGIEQEKKNVCEDFMLAKMLTKNGPLCCDVFFLLDSLLVKALLALEKLIH
jgi:hypothetical protein